MRTLRIGWSLFTMVFKRRLEYRGDLFIQSLDELLRGALALVMLQVYLSRTQSVAGWSEAEMLFIFGFAMVPLALFHCFCGNLYQLAGHYLIQGHFDRVLLRPYPTFLQVCFDRIAVEDLSGAVLGIAVMAYAVSGGAVDQFGLVQGALLLGLVLSSLAIVVAVFMTFAATSFWFEDRVGMMPPVYNLMEFGRWPTAIYHWTVKWLVTLAIPFAFTAFYPASLFLESGADPAVWQVAVWTPIVGMVALALAALAWGAGVRRYGSTGN